MKKIQNRLLLALCLLAPLAGCDKGFDQLNVNPIAATSLNPGYLLNNAIIRSSFPNNTLVYELAIVQQMVTPNSGVLAGGNFNQSNRDISLGLWQRYYQEVLKHTLDALEKAKADPARTNLHQMARIWRAYAAMVLTDTYGDVPYTQASLGFLSGTVSPQYDAQQAIYTDLLKELDEAAAALDAAKPRENSDVLYGGDVVKWKRLGYSLMLRAAMRLTKANASTAQSYAAKAAAGGVMQTNADNAVVRHTGLYTNEMGTVLSGTERGNYYLAAPFVNYLRTTGDPRLGAIAVRYPGVMSGSEQDLSIEAGHSNRTPAAQVGMPLGYDNGTIVAVAQQAGLSSFYEYSQLDRTRMGSRFAPAFLVTAAQTKLLLAEAVVRGWATGSAADLYRSGIEAHMTQLELYGPETAIARASIDAYLQANPLDNARALEQINTQYWVASFLNGPEAFANFRRSGFPALTPNPYPGKEITGAFIRRLNYPDSEFSVNQANLQAAITRQGPDNLDTPVWWDKP